MIYVESCFEKSRSHMHSFNLWTFNLWTWLTSDSQKQSLRVFSCGCFKPHVYSFEPYLWIFDDFRIEIPFPKKISSHFLDLFFQNSSSSMVRTPTNSIPAPSSILPRLVDARLGAEDLQGFLGSVHQFGGPGDHLLQALGLAHLENGGRGNDDMTNHGGAQKTHVTCSQWSWPCVCFLFFLKHLLFCVEELETSASHFPFLVGFKGWSAVGATYKKHRFFWCHKRVILNQVGYNHNGSQFDRDLWLTSAYFWSIALEQQRVGSLSLWLGVWWMVPKFFGQFYYAKPRGSVEFFILSNGLIWANPNIKRLRTLPSPCPTLAQACLWCHVLWQNCLLKRRKRHSASSSPTQFYNQKICSHILDATFFLQKTGNFV